jgi:hypothetical protein
MRDRLGDRTPPAPPRHTACQSDRTLPGSPLLPPGSSSPILAATKSKASEVPGQLGRNRGAIQWPPMGRSGGRQRGLSMGRATWPTGLVSSRRPYRDRPRLTAAADVSPWCRATTGRPWNATTHATPSRHAAGLRALAQGGAVPSYRDASLCL